MDPLSITTALLSFWEVGLRLKASISKISGNHHHLRELMDDIVSTLNSMKNFYDLHQLSLSTLPLEELKESLDRLQQSLLRICHRCEKMVPPTSQGAFRRISSRYTAWKNVAQVEAEIVRFKESITLWFNQVNLLITARNEVTIAKIEHTLLLSLQESRWRTKQIDYLFNKAICHPNLQYGGIEMVIVAVNPNTQGNEITHQTFQEQMGELDDLCHQYISFKLVDMHEMLTKQTQHVSITPGTHFSTIACPYSRHERMDTQITLATLIPRLSGLSRGIPLAGTDSLSQLSLLSIMGMLDDLSILGIENTIIVRYFDYFIDNLRSSLPYQTYDANTKELLLWIFVMLLKRWFLTPWGPEYTHIALDLLKVAKELQRLPASSEEAHINDTYLHHGLLICILTYCANEDFAMTLPYIEESFQVFLPTYQPGQPIQSLQLSTTTDALVRGAISVQRQAATLYWTAQVQAALGDYCEARCFAKDSMSLLEDLAINSRYLPADFYYFTELYAALESNISTWVSVCHGLSVSAPWIEDTEDIVDLDNSDTYVEWGIAI